MDMIRLPPDFKDFLRLFNENRVEYLVVGGYAVSYHGYPRTTADIDLWIAVAPTNARKVLKSVNDFGLSHSRFVVAGLDREPMRVERFVVRV